MKFFIALEINGVKLSNKLNVKNNEWRPYAKT